MASNVEPAKRHRNGVYTFCIELISVKNKNGTYICNYDTNVSDPIPSHYLESPLEKATDVKRGEYERVYTATVDPDVAKMENLMDQWCLDLKRNVLVSNIRTFEPPHDKTNKMACVPSEDSDQPGHPPSLIRVVAVHMKKAWVLSYPLSAQRRL